jgi:hypothetical protein
VAQVVLLSWRTPPKAKSFPVREAFRGGPVRLLLASLAFHYQTIDAKTNISRNGAELPTYAA